MLSHNYDQIKLACRMILSAIGEDPNREGLKDTPRRFADMWQEFIHYDPGTLDTTFQTLNAGDQMVVVKGMRVWSLCEHHLLPFWCDISIGYIPDNDLLGLSKFARIAHHNAHRLQLQEKLVDDIADELSIILGTDDIAVYGEGEHLCMSMRGIKTPSQMITSVMHGVFRTDPRARAEFLHLID